jgi:hypothetical protein
MSAGRQGGGGGLDKGERRGERVGPSGDWVLFERRGRGRGRQRKVKVEGGCRFSVSGLLSMILMRHY